MSVYDPFRIYDRRTKSSHIGQVIRKKTPRLIGECYTDDQINSFIESLVRRGYRVFAPGEYNPAPIVVQKLEHNFIYPNISLGTLTYSSNVSYHYNFSDIWNNVSSDFSDILAISHDRIRSFSFSFSLISFCFGGDVNYLGNTGVADIAVHFPPSDQYSEDMFQLIIDGHDLGFGDVSSRTNLFWSYQGDFLFVNPKLVHNDTPFLNTVTSTDLSTLTAIRDKDYTQFDPEILRWNVDSIQQTESFTMNLHGICVSVSLAIDYV